MAARFSRLLSLCLALLFCLSAQASLFSPTTNNRFVPVDQAFGFDFSQQGHQLTLSWKVKDGYYLYRQQFHISAQHAQLAPVTLPPGQPHEDEFYGKSEIYPQDVKLPITLRQADAGATLSVTYQGCAAAGFCYPPETRSVPLTAMATDSAAPAIAASPAADRTPLPFSPLWALLIGIGVAFTPCVLPMYPLISGIILGGQRRYSLGRLFALALVYVQGMALTYTLLGMVVAAAGLRFQAALQHPYVLIGLSVLFVLLALSMFGLFTLQLPASLQTRLTLWSNRQQGGSLAGVFMMGALAGLICSPCTTAPLSAILLYIAQSCNLWAGAGTLWLYAFGMGLPLIAVTMFGNRLLPKSGPWMQSVKEGFGFVILALPVFLLERVLGDIWGLRLWSLLGVAFFAWAFSLSLNARGTARVLPILMLAAALVVARPLQDWAFGSSSTQSVAHLPFQRISSSQQLDSALQQAQGRITMVDLYADWCVACKEFEKYTFSDDGVRSALSNVQLLQANVTANNAQDNALLQHLQVLGLPTILFFDAQGKEIADSRVTGFLNAADFRAHLHNLPR
ncbi:protein-disulfide reductase DsbD [Pantoea dispersa]|uniref:Thiol:disulfide interchange protein DsbD n=1 Tax=Pantoea dispersa TaxID=59814 RepID=A0A8E1RWX7_9GAMM|nr:protein-disulfide reductase DsbD [Pantoea dispersa]KTR88869.1 thiol:disulfide interchange protein precursor [Pantoea dispersa]KTS22482.1 thiol:disulfide interchange protein precursor [Pantoea dispersa]KTS63527.1 thiol:disulfide interchange protein precursor [Pantoea dispersa]KTS66785.1 thiol:disulfide interchange protein precursor [Pantoea dispersa]